MVCKHKIMVIYFLFQIFLWFCYRNPELRICRLLLIYFNNSKASKSPTKNKLRGKHGELIIDHFKAIYEHNFVFVDIYFIRSLWCYNSHIYYSSDDSSEDEKPKKPVAQINGNAQQKKKESSDSDSSEDEKPQSKPAPKVQFSLLILIFNLTQNDERLWLIYMWYYFKPSSLPLITEIEI